VGKLAVQRVIKVMVLVTAVRVEKLVEVLDLVLTHLVAVVVDGDLLVET
jgi:hypothetical protein